MVRKIVLDENTFVNHHFHRFQRGVNYWSDRFNDDLSDEVLKIREDSKTDVFSFIDDLTD
jgi:uncharacterized protein with LGFP repeats